MREMSKQKTLLEVEYEIYKTEFSKYTRTLVYHPSNSKKGFPIKGTNIRVSFKYIKKLN